jgi:hypothetical protein
MRIRGYSIIWIIHKAHPIKVAFYYTLYLVPGNGAGHHKSAIADLLFNKSPTELGTYHADLVAS